MIKKSIFIALVFTALFGFKEAASAAPDFYITSDVHIGPAVEYNADVDCSDDDYKKYCTNDGDGTPTKSNKKRFKELIQKLDIKNISNRYLLVSGDIVQQGVIDEYDTMQNVISGEGIGQKIYISLGNHELRPINQEATEDGYDNRRQNFLDYIGAINSTKTFENVKIVRIGTDFENRPVVPWNRKAGSTVASERTSVFFYISEGTKTFLRNELASAKAAGQTVIILCHWPVPYTVQNSGGTTGGLEQHRIADSSSLAVDSSIQNIIKDYPNAILISGHSHEYFNSNWKKEEQKLPKISRRK